jgi:hypothetical protein
MKKRRKEAETVDAPDEIEPPAHCGAAAPLVVNGGHFAGCDLPPGHEGAHHLEVRWR